MESEDTTTPSPEDTVVADTKPDPLTELAGSVNQLSQIVLNLANDVEYLKNPQKPPPPEDLLPPELPEGVVRFFSKHKDYTMFIEDENKLVVGGQVVTQKATPRAATRSGDARALNWDDHIRDETDPAIIEYLMKHKDYGVDFVVDTTARKKTSHVKVEQGVRGMKAPEPESSPLEASY